jgi:hypothetical protein
MQFSQSPVLGRRFEEFGMRKQLHYCSSVLSALAAVSAALLPGLAIAQVETLPEGDLSFLPDKNGFDMVNGGLLLDNVGVSLGEGSSAGVRFERTFLSYEPYGSNDNFNYQLTAATIPNDPVTGQTLCMWSVTIGLSSKIFDCNQAPYSPVPPDGSTLTATMNAQGYNDYTFTGRDGTIVQFNNENISVYGQWVNGLVAAYVIRPNGERFDFTYHRHISGGAIQKRRRSSINFSNGTQLKFQYASDSTSSDDWWRLANVRSINAAVDYCSPTANSCTSFSQTWPSMTMSLNQYTSGIWTYRDQTAVAPSGVTTTYQTQTTTSSGYGNYSRVYRGGVQLIEAYSYQTSSPLTSHYDLDKLGQSWGYSSVAPDPSSCYVSPYICPETQTWSRLSPESGTFSVQTYLPPAEFWPQGHLGGQHPIFFVGKPTYITDELGRTTRFQYDSVGRGTNTIPPEGTPSSGPPTAGYVNNTYDTRGNVTAVTKVAKAGSSLPNIVTSASFSASCSTLKTCNQPNSTTDANGNVTNYTYDSAHGGILTEMKPAVTIGTPGSTVSARPLTVTTWTQRYAWIKNSSGVLVQSPDPIWLISTVTACQGSPGSNSPVCDASKPQTVTTYQYGATGTRESLLVKGVAVASGGVTLRTCYGYDVFNRRISETEPNASLSTCP